MNYILKETQRKSGKYTLEESLKSLEIRLNKDKKEEMNIDKILLCDEELKEIYINKMYKKKLSKLIVLINEIVLIMESEDDGTEDVQVVLDEINKLKGIILNKYKEHIKIETYRKMLKGLLILEEKFKEKYMNIYYSKQKGKSI